jgi:RNA polymerase sigma factor (sigma-70 family)
VDDGQIVELFLRRNERAIQEINAKYGSYCFSVANNILYNREDAEECVNDTWVRAWNAIPPQRPEHLRLFVAKITRNLAFDKVKSQMAYKRGCGSLSITFEELTECISSANDIETEYQVEELKKSINRFLYTLARRDCDVFLRRYFYVESIHEIGERYDLKDGNVLVILSRTRKKLKNYLQGEDHL